MHEAWADVGSLGPDADYDEIVLSAMGCPECERALVSIKFRKVVVSDQGPTDIIDGRRIVYPRIVTRQPPPTEVPEPLAQDFREAGLVLNDSPKASAALSRRCLQVVLRDQAGVKPSDLSKEIDEAMPHLPPYLAGAVDAVRHVGNFAAHPMKSQSTGEVIDVEPGEAEWLLDVLEGLFAFYFVEPAALQHKRAALNQKLADIGKPALKEPPPVLGT